jgi:two-component system cell cycle sensor histidine kinase/response regulator CckA
MPMRPEHYALFLDHATDAIMLHRDGVVVDANAQACESLGYTLDELIGRSPQDFDANVTEAGHAALRLALDGGRAIGFDTHHRRKDGTTFPVEVRIRRFQLDGVVHTVSVSRDITARMRVEEALRAKTEALAISEERFSLAMRGATDGLWDWDLVTDRVYYSPRWKAMLGYAEGDLPNTVETWRTLLHPDDAVEAEQRVADYLGGRIPAYEIEFRMRHADGSYVDVLSRGYATYDADHRPIRLVGTHVDITERKRTETALRESELMLRRAQEVAALGSWTFDPAGVAFALSGEALRIYGLDGPPPSLEAWLALVHPEDAARFGVAWDAMCRGERSAVEHRLAAHGDARWVAVNGTADRDPTGRLTRIVGTTQDITARRRLEGQYRQAQKMEAVGQLSAGIAHDFNNLLWVIAITVDLLIVETPRTDPKREDLAAIRSASEHAADLVRQLLAFSRTQMVQPRDVDINDSIRHSEKMLRRLVTEDIAIRTELDPALLLVRADPGHVEQVLVNLVVNARDAMPSGGSLVLATSMLDLVAELPCDAYTVPPGRYARLTVTDTGCGIPKDVRNRIFEPFFTTKGVGRGTGLGLATVYGIVKQSHGFVSVDSEVGKGTRFTLLLPAVEPAPAVPASEGGETAIRSDGETLLLVEDDETLRRMERRVLQLHGYRVLEASGVADAVAVAAAHPGAIDLVITDMVMADGRGPDVAAALKGRVPRVLYVSGYTDDALVRGGLEHVTRSFLQKPFAPDVLAEKVRAVLDGPPTDTPRRARRGSTPRVSRRST